MDIEEATEIYQDRDVWIFVPKPRRYEEKSGTKKYLQIAIDNVSNEMFMPTLRVLHVPSLPL